MALCILGIGTATPRRMAQEAAAAAMKRYCCRDERQARLFDKIYQNCDVRTRASIILEEPNGSPIRQSFFPTIDAQTYRGPTTRQRMERYAEEAGSLALTAARPALLEAGVAAQQIDHLVTVSCTGFEAPGVDVALIKQLDLRPTVTRTHVGFMGCHGAINGLRVAESMLTSGQAGNVLLCAVELCSLHFHYGWDLDKVKANALFADGAAALVASAAHVAQRPSAVPAQPGAAEPHETWKMVSTGSCLLPDSEDAMSWRIGDHGFEMTMSSSIAGLIGHHLRPWIEQWLGAHGLDPAQVPSWAVHPGGPRIVNNVAESLNLSQEAVAASREVLAECGNMSSPTLLFILDRLRRAGAPRPCVALGFGPGLVVEAALLV